MGKKKEVLVDANKVKKVKQADEAVLTKVKSQKKPLTKKRGKSYSQAKVSFDRTKLYTLKEVVAKLQALSLEKFDPTVELHLNLLEKNLKGEVNLPHGTGREVKIAIFSPEVEALIESNKINFDILLASPKDMPKLVRLAKVLGPKGLMPSPKKGTLTDKIEEAVKKLSSGVVLYKSEPKFPLLHQSVGKKSFKPEQLVENVTVFIKAVGRKNIAQAYLKTSMSPALKLDLTIFS